MGALDLAGKEEGLEERRAVEAAEQAMREEEEGGNGQHKVRLANDQISIVFFFISNFKYIAKELKLH